jgi:hypothetical protein
LAVISFSLSQGPPPETTRHAGDNHPCVPSCLAPSASSVIARSSLGIPLSSRAGAFVPSLGRSSDGALLLSWSREVMAGAGLVASAAERPQRALTLRTTQRD